MPDTQDVNSNLELEVSIAEVLSLVIEKWRILFFSVLSFAVAGVFYSLSLPEIFRASVLMTEAYESSQVTSGGLPEAVTGAYGRFAGVSLGRKSTSLEQGLALLKSKRFAEEFIQKQNLSKTLFADEWDAKNNEWIDGEGPSKWQIYREFNAMMSTSLNAEGMVLLSLEFTDRVLAANIANAIVSYINEMMRNEAIQEAEKSIDFLEGELKKTNLVNSQSILYSLIEQQTEKIMIASVRDQYTFKVIDPAVVPDERISPNRRNIVMFFGLIGVFIGLCAVAFVVALPRIRSYFSQSSASSRQLT